MILIGENIHIISKMVRAALENRDEAFVLESLKKQNVADIIDLNVGPAKNKLEGVLPWLCEIVENNSDFRISFDTTNSNEMRKGLETSKFPEKAILNSTNADEERLDKISNLASEFNCSLVGLTMNKEVGIPSCADGRLELAFEIYEKCIEKGIEPEKIYFDPLILPISVNQGQALEALNTIQMIKQSFDPPTLTTIGLSNISNGSPAEYRPLINRVFVVLAYGAGLDSAIIDVTDEKLVKTLKMLEGDAPESEEDKLYLDLAKMISEFGEIEDIKYSKENKNIIKAARIILGKDIYSHSFTQV